MRAPWIQNASNHTTSLVNQTWRRYSEQLQKRVVTTWPSCNEGANLDLSLLQLAASMKPVPIRPLLPKAVSRFRAPMNNAAASCDET